MHILNKIVGFRSNKLWKKIIATIYYLFILLYIIILASIPYSEEIIQYGNNQDKLVDIIQKIAFILMLLTPIVVMKMKEIFKLNIPISMLVAFVYFIFSCYLMVCIPNSKQYEDYLSSKKETEKVEIENTQLNNTNNKNVLNEDEDKDVDANIKDNVNINENEISTNKTEPIEVKELELNPLLKLEFKEKTVYNGLKTEEIGKYCYFDGNEDILNCSEQEWLEFKTYYDEKLKDYNWIEININKDTYIHFINDLSIGTYYKRINDDERISLENIIFIKDFKDSKTVELNVLENNEIYFKNIEKIVYYDIDGNEINENQSSANDFDEQMENAKYYDTLLKEYLSSLYNAYEEKYIDFSKISKLELSDLDLIMQNAQYNSNINCPDNIIFNSFLKDNSMEIEIIIISKPTDEHKISIANFNKNDVEQLKEKYFSKYIQEFSNNLKSLTNIENEITFMIGSKTVDIISSK